MNGATFLVTTEKQGQETMPPWPHPSVGTEKDLTPGRTTWAFTVNPQSELMPLKTKPTKAAPPLVFPREDILHSPLP